LAKSIHLLAESPEHIYKHPGTYEVTLVVIDNDGTTDTDIIEVTIGDYVNRIPTASHDGPYEGITGKSITFSGTNSYDSDGTITNYTWNFGDGKEGYGEITKHKYSETGSYLIMLTVTDNDGGIHTAVSSVDIEEGETPGFEIIFFIIATSIIFLRRKIVKK
jgi:PKD repeat protein